MWAKFTAFIIALIAPLGLGVETRDLCGPLSMRTQADNQIWTMEDFVRAGIKANEDLRDWLRVRSDRLRKLSLVLGPNLDGTYFYRLGNMKDFDRFSAGQEIDGIRQKLIAQGFPRLEPEELYLINLTNYAARMEALPNTPLCVKHFPGGDERLEITEDRGLLYENRKENQFFIRPFLKILTTSKAPACVMLSHARYSPELFVSSRVNLGPLLGDFEFSQVPASLNPAVVEYLRHNLNYKGIIAADWLAMGAIHEFIDSIHKPYSFDLLAFVAGSYANVDFLPGLHFQTEEMLAVEIASLPPPTRLDLERHLDRWVDDLFQRLQIPPLKNPLSMAGKIALKASLSRSRSSNTVANYLAPEASKKILDLVGNASDPWNRSGILVFMQRQMIVETLFKQPNHGFPESKADESSWMKRLSRDLTFQKSLNSIPWISPVFQSAFCHIRQSNYPVQSKSSPAF